MILFYKAFNMLYFFIVLDPQVRSEDVALFFFYEKFGMARKICALNPLILIMG